MPPAAPTTVTGQVQRVWRTQLGEEGCVLQLADKQHLTLYGPLPPLKRGQCLQAEIQGNTILKATRMIQEWEIAWAFYSQLSGFARASAQKIVSLLGDDTHMMITQQASLLDGVKGIPASGVRAMQEHARRQGRFYTTLKELAALGLFPEHAQRLIRREGAGAPRVFQDNPFLAVRFDIPLRVIDHAAAVQGLSSFDPRRGPALAFELVQRATTEHGHTCLPEHVLKLDLREHHALEDDEAQTALEQAVQHELLVCARTTYALPEQHHTERRLADDLARLFTAPLPILPLPSSFPLLTDEQRAAVQLACTCALTVITGGPGTGKTTTLKALLDTLDLAGLTTVLCAPTGKAASRMQQSTGRDATTLHRLLSYDGDQFSNGVLPFDAVVVDEVSMASNALLGALLRSVPTGARVILVGDEDQLPPIDPGHPLAALIRTLPTARLTRTHRQAQDSPILALAQLLISGEKPAGTGVPFHAADTTADLVQLVEAQMTPAGPPMILTAGRAGPLGVDALNTALQAALNPGTGAFRVGDPVLITRNDHALGLMNGMTGRVLTVTPQFTCEFDGQPYELSLSIPISLAYAMTIHRSQGSEWDRVIVVLSDDHTRLLSRQLAYTAVTRAKRDLTAAGQRSAWNRAAMTGAARCFSQLEALLRE
ncbi:AAA family ATPase [Deinococcus ruber]|uniref:ATP-dependent RecD-like DNA helicase n=1 Tax=Deinococcus ruber TaxID=1848197 RepID=A0A918CKY8_9DEIO|nr:AAA family ATPase [Deinococcus ruber]GGR30706.1 ATP-dependent RecD-like DNA helicase [Deinococcus ruber]